jgi:hypothetical protein
MDGVTARVSGFPLALTQFLSASDVRQLARVSCLDHKTANAVWTIGCALMNPVNHPGQHIVNILRGEVCPGFHCVAWSLGWRMCQAYFKAVAGHQPSESRTALGFKRADQKIYAHRCCSVGFEQWNVKGNIITRSRGRTDSLHVDQPFLTALSQRMWSSVWSRDWSMDGGFERWRECSFDVCTTALLEMLVLYGPTFHFVMVGGMANVALFIDLWFELGVAPILPLEPMRMGDFLDISSLLQFQQHATQN